MLVWKISPGKRKKIISAEKFDVETEESGENYFSVLLSSFIHSF